MQGIIKMKQKSRIEMIVLPLVVASVGAICTYFITYQQIESAKEISKAQRSSAFEIADSDRQIQLLEIFSKHITSSNKQEQQIALKVLEAMDDGGLAVKLATVVAENKSANNETKKLAREVIETSSEKGYWFAVIGSYRKIKDAKDAKDKVEKLLKKLLKSDEYTPEIYRSWNFYYAVTLGGYLSRSEANKRVNYAKENIANDAYPYKTRTWGKKLVY
jgi:hypothetical protein